MELHRKYRCVSEKMEQSIRKSIYRGELLPGKNFALKDSWPESLRFPRVQFIKFLMFWQQKD